MCCIGVPFAFGFMAIALGQDANWDLQNYHWYNPYAFLNHRFLFDLAPGSYYNPVLDVPLFLLAQHLSARECGFLLGLVQGLNFVPLYAIALAVAPQWARWKNGTGGAMLSALGVTGGGGLGLVGATSYDNVVSVLVLTALGAIVRSMRGATESADKTYAIAGLLTGFGIGMKLPTAIFGVGLVCACFSIEGPLRRRLRRTVWFGFPALVGMLVFGGYWMWWLWSNLGNPVFPYFNNVFGSEMALSATYRDERFVPTSFIDAALFPLRFTMDPFKAGDCNFTDLRIALLYGVLALSAAWIFGSRHWTRVGTPQQLTPEARLVLSAAAFSYITWLALFGIYRYIITLEMLAPLLTASLIAGWPIRHRTKITIACLCAVMLIVGTRPWSGDRIEWESRFVEVAAPRLKDPLHAMVVVAGFVPSSWVIPSFPPEVPFVRLQGYSHSPDDGNVGLAREARSRVAQHRGTLYVLYAESEEALVRDVLRKFDLVGDFAACERVRGNLAAGLRLCPVSRGSIQAGR